MNEVIVPLASSSGFIFLNSWRSKVVQIWSEPSVARLSVSVGMSESSCRGVMFVAICTSITQLESAFS